MNDARLRKLAEQTGIAIKKIAEWHFVHGPRYASTITGVPTGKRKRPKGMLSVGEIVLERGVPLPVLMEWRRAGLKTRRMGNMVLVRKSDLEDWLAEHPVVRRGRGRPRGS